MQFKLTGKVAAVFQKKYLDPYYYLVRCDQCRELIDTRTEKCQCEKESHDGRKNNRGAGRMVGSKVNPD